MRKSNYTRLFEDLYDWYKRYGDNDATWQYIFSNLKEFKKKTLNRSQCYKNLYDEAECEINLAILDSFRSYDDTRNASLYTWCYRLCAQAIWRFVRDKIELVNCDYLEEIEIPTIEIESPEDTYISEENEEAVNAVKEKLKVIFGGPIELEVFSMMNGLFGYQEMKIKEISEETNFSVNTIYFVNQKNNKTIKALRKYLKENNLDIYSFDVEKYLKTNNKICTRSLF